MKQEPAKLNCCQLSNKGVTMLDTPKIAPILTNGTVISKCIFNWSGLGLSRIFSVLCLSPFSFYLFIYLFIGKHEGISQKKIT
jgi:hypothetical protein